MWNTLCAGQLVEISDPAMAAALFRKSVKMIEIEVFSFCNRRCWFCPNSHIDRLSENILMPHGLYSSLIDQLASIGYGETITYSRYNEPLADRVILERLKEAHSKLPGATLHANTNADFLTPEYLEELYEAGLRSLHIQVYLGNNDRYDHDRIKKKTETILERIPLPREVVVDRPGLWYQLNLSFKDMVLRLYGRNFEANGTNRCGQVDINRDYVRTSPCITPFWSVYIDYNGKVVPCCNFRSDIEEHIPYITQDLTAQDNLFLAYANEAASSFRRSLLNAEPKEGLCANCFFHLWDVTPERSAIMHSILEGYEHTQTNGWSIDDTSIFQCPAVPVSNKILWRRTGDNRATLWSLDESGNKVSEKNYGPYEGWKPISYHKDHDGTGRIVWERTADGLVSLWTVEASGKVLSKKNYGPFPGWRAVNYHGRMDGSPRLLWAKPSTGEASLWTLNASDTKVSSKTFGPEAGWKPLTYHDKPDGTSRILWVESSSGQAMLLTMNAADRVVSQKYYGPVSGWIPTSYHQNDDGTARLLWTNPGTGAASIWKLDASDNRESTKIYSLSGHTAQSYG